MMFRRAVIGVTVVVGLAAGAASVLAQRTPPPDSLYRRAQRMVADGDSGKGRALVDSLLAATVEGSNARANALFWRATLAADANAAELDYITIVVDYSLAPRAADALLRLGQAEYGRGDRAAAIRHLDRLVRDHHESSAAPDGWYWLGLARLGDADAAGGCAALDSARTRLTPSEVERRQQIAYRMQSCRALPAAPVPPTPEPKPPVKPPPPPTSVPPKTVPAPSPTPAARPDTALRWSAQVAAYNIKSEAEKLAKTLQTRGYEARVDDLKLFHVRIGLYKKRAEAAAVVARLKQQGITAIIVEASPRGS